MRKLLFILLLLPSLLYAQVFTSPINIRESDGSPLCYPFRLIVPDTSLACSNVAIATLDYGAGIGATLGAGEVAHELSGDLVGDPQFTFVDSGSTLTVGTWVFKDSAPHIDNGGTVSVDDTWTFNPSGLGGITDYDISIGDTDGTPTYGIIRIGNAIIGRTSYNTANMDLDGAILYRNVGGPVTGNLEHVFTESTGSSTRFALPKAGAGLGTYNSRSMIIAGPAPADTDYVTVSYWQTNNNIFDNLAMDTSGTGADLGVQNDLEVEGDIFVDSIKESTSGAGVTFPSGGWILNDGVIGEVGTAGTGAELSSNGSIFKIDLDTNTIDLNIDTDGDADMMNIDQSAGTMGIGQAADDFDKLSVTNVLDAGTNSQAGFSLTTTKADGAGTTQHFGFRNIYTSSDADASNQVAFFNVVDLAGARPGGSASGAAVASIVGFQGTGTISEFVGNEARLTWAQQSDESDLTITMVEGFLVKLRTAGAGWAASELTMPTYRAYDSMGQRSEASPIHGTDWAHYYARDFPDLGGTVTSVSGMWIENQTYGGTNNYGIVLDGAGNDIVFGSDQTDRVYSDDLHLILNAESATRTIGGRAKQTTRITDSDSPYTVLVTDHKIFADTDGGAITINLLAGVNGTEYPLYNTGSNDVTVVPSGAELLDGVNASKAFSKGQITLTYETTEGWL